MSEKRFYILGVFLFFGFLGGCYAGNLSQGIIIVPAGNHAHTTTVITHYEPPPHTAAHGYRHRYYNHELQFNTGFGAYMVISNPGLYFHNGYYIRFYSNGWQISNRLGNPWRSAHQSNIPHKLRKHVKKHDAQQYRHHNSDYEIHHNKAPNHGHRRHHQGHKLSYDSHAGAYIIGKRPGIYFYNNRYLRHRHGRWQSANKLNGAWRPAKRHHMSEKLIKTKHARKSSHAKRKKHKNQHQRLWF